MEHANPWIGLGDRVEPVGRSVGRPSLAKTISAGFGSRSSASASA